jgi:hypothetical protein
MPIETRERQGSRSLLDVCLDVHMHHNGSSDCQTPTEFLADIRLLADALTYWKASSCSFDMAVHSLIRATLLEVGEETVSEGLRNQRVWPAELFKR